MAHIGKPDYEREDLDDQDDPFGGALRDEDLDTDDDELDDDDVDEDIDDDDVEQEARDVYGD